MHAVFAALAIAVALGTLPHRASAADARVPEDIEELESFAAEAEYAGAYGEAESALEKAFDRCREACAPDPVRSLRWAVQLGRVRYWMRSDQEKDVVEDDQTRIRHRERLREVIVDSAAHGLQDSPAFGDVATDFVNRSQSDQEKQDARDVLLEAVRQAERQHGRVSAAHALSLIWLDRAEVSLGDRSRSVQRLTSSAEILDRVLEADDPERARPRLILAYRMDQEKDFTKAQGHLEEGISIVESTRPPRSQMYWGVGAGQSMPLNLGFYWLERNAGKERLNEPTLAGEARARYWRYGRRVVAHDPAVLVTAVYQMAAEPSENGEETLAAERLDELTSIFIRAGDDGRVRWWEEFSPLVETLIKNGRKAPALALMGELRRRISKVEARFPARAVRMLGLLSASYTQLRESKLSEETAVQAARLLGRACPGADVATLEVINAGIAAWTSPEELHQFRENLLRCTHDLAGVSEEAHSKIAILEGGLLEKLRRWAEAERIYVDVLERWSAPHDLAGRTLTLRSAAYVGLGRTQWEQGRLVEAFDTYERLVAEDASISYKEGYVPANKGASMMSGLLELADYMGIVEHAIDVTIDHIDRRLKALGAKDGESRDAADALQTVRVFLQGCGQKLPLRQWIAQSSAPLTPMDVAAMVSGPDDRTMEYGRIFFSTVYAGFYRFRVGDYERADALLRPLAENPEVIGMGWDSFTGLIAKTAEAASKLSRTAARPDPNARSRESDVQQSVDFDPLRKFCAILVADLVSNGRESAPEISANAELSSEDGVEGLRIAGKVTPVSGIAFVSYRGRLALPTGDGRFSFAVSAEALEKDRKLQITTRAGVSYSAEVKVPASIVLGRDSRLRRIALVIGNESYARGWPRLLTPAADASAVAASVADRFGFSLELPGMENQTRSLLLINASRSDIMSAFDALAEHVQPDDEVLVYYAGHGYLDKTIGRAYWIPVDADQGRANWISAHDVTDQLKRLKARSILVVADSCYSGAMLRGFDTEGEETGAVSGERGVLVEKLRRRRSRVLISSGSSEPVNDGGGDGHSVFARAFLTALRESSGPGTPASEMFAQWLRGKVVGNSDQVPQYMVIQNSGHEGGDFVFVPRR